MFIRDLLYLDRARARRLLGDVDGGVVEQVVSSVASRRSGHLSGGVPGLAEAGGDLGRDSTVEETLSVDDALLSVVEETLEQASLLTLPEEITDPDAWEHGRVHGQFEPASLIKLTCESQLIDPDYFASSVNRVVDAIETMAIFSAGPSAMSKGGNERSKIAQRVSKEILDGMPPDLVRQLGDAISKFFGEGVVIRQLPCGPEHRSYGLLGNLVPAGLLDDRVAVFAKYGAAPSRWTVLSQIATVPAPPENSTLGSGVSDNDDESEVNRSDFERIAGEMMVALEETGLVGGPVWPAVTISPIAVYRTLEIGAS